MKNNSALLPLAVTASLLALAPRAAVAQAEPQALAALLGQEILPPAVALHELRQHIVARVPGPPEPASAAQWTREAGALRARLLGEVVFHGWPRHWVDAPPRFEETGVIEANGYRVRKLRYEIVPGMAGAALLYEPSPGGSGQRPAVLSVNGHVGAEGKAVEYKQKRAITLAKNGVLALDLEWLGMGELAAKDSSHWYAGHLDLVGVHELGLFYLAMRRGLDYLHEHPGVDRERIGMTGLSGGGWQTIVLSALDERVRASAPVAGFNGMAAKAVARAYGDTGDPEQSATDLFSVVDYAHLAAMVAPRPLLLAFNAEDNCCFRSGMVKPAIERPTRRVYELYGRAAALAWHENDDPGTHNYQLDNREQAYRFFSRAFSLPAPITSDDPAAAPELRTAEELAVGLPADNLTILGLARRLGAEIRREPRPPEAARPRLARVVRHVPTRVESAWLVASTRERGVEALSYLLRLGDGLSAEAVRMKAVTAPAGAGATILIGDGGRKSLAAEAAARLNRADTVLALDLAFLGEAWAARETRRLLQNLNGLGERPLGLQAAQLAAVAGWLKASAGAASLRLEASGPRSQAVALVASALEPGLFSELVVRDGLVSFAELLDKPVGYLDAPELFCLGLYQEIDVAGLAALSSPSRVVERRSPMSENP